ncbi:unnamed protein product [Rhodiola kirilowii]
MLIFNISHSKQVNLVRFVIRVVFRVRNRVSLIQIWFATLVIQICLCPKYPAEMGAGTES